MLTRLQRKALTFIIVYIKNEGVVPSYVEMQTGLGINTKSGVHRLIQGLVERGYIRTIPHLARSIEVLRGPDDKAPELLLTNAELKAIGYLRQHKDVLAQILERCE